MFWYVLAAFKKSYRQQLAKIFMSNGEKKLLWVHGKGRSGKDEFVLLTPAALTPYIIILQERVIKNEKEPLFGSLSDRIMEANNNFFIIQMIKKRLRAAGFDSKRITAHSLRHTFGVLLCKREPSLYEVQLAMRHTTSTTTQLYLGDI